MWFTLARSNRYSPLPARLAPGVRASALCCDIFVSWSAVTCRLVVGYLPVTWGSSCRSGECARRCAAGDSPEQGLRRRAEYRSLLRRPDREAANLQHAIRHAHVERVVAAEQHAIRAGAADEEFESIFRVHDGVEVEPLERVGRRLRELLLRLRAHLPAVHKAPGLVRNKAT